MGFLGQNIREFVWEKQCAEPNWHSQDGSHGFLSPLIGYLPKIDWITSHLLEPYDRTMAVPSK